MEVIMQISIVFEKGRYQFNDDIGDNMLVLTFLLDILRSFMMGRCIVEQAVGEGKPGLYLMTNDIGKYIARSSIKESEIATYFSAAMANSMAKQYVQEYGEREKVYVNGSKSKQG
jgi:hypothetical protein